MSTGRASIDHNAQFIAHAPDVYATARTAELGSAVIGVIFEDPLSEIAELRDPAMREVERLLARRAGM